MKPLVLAVGVWLLLGAAFDMPWERRAVAVVGVLVVWFAFAP